MHLSQYNIIFKNKQTLQIEVIKYEINTSIYVFILNSTIKYL